jgi:general stress protein 26
VISSFSGKAKIVQDREVIKKHWSSVTSAWFGDLGDGVHKGDANDPRVSIIEVVPDEIRFWYPTATSVGRAMEIAVAAATGNTAAPGELHTITKDEVSCTSFIFQGIL